MDRDVDGIIRVGGCVDKVFYEIKYFYLFLKEYWVLFFIVCYLFRVGCWLFDYGIYVSVVRILCFERGIGFYD